MILEILTKLIIEKVIENHMSESIPISEAKKMRSGVNVEAEVIGKGDPRTVNLKSGNGTVDVCDATIANGDGTVENQMKLTLWGDDIKACLLYTSPSPRDRG